MTRYIVNYDPSALTDDFLKSLDWDIIELPISIDATSLVEWYNQVEIQFPHLEFSFFNNPYIKEQFVPKSRSDSYGYSGGLYGDITSWGIDWPAETDLPIPPPFAVKQEFYPEMFTSGNPFKIQLKYNFGYFKELLTRFGNDAFRYSRITKHYPGAGIHGHTDTNPPAMRVHIPIVSNENSKFFFGDNLDRYYTFEVGKMYILNASVWHSTTNTTDIRAHIISDPVFECIKELVKGS